MTPTSKGRLLSVWGAALLMLTGCGGSAPPAAGPSHVKGLAGLYNQATFNLGHRPANEQEFKAALAKSILNLKLLGVSTIDELFVSERDDQPLVVLYGPPAKEGDPGVVVYEQQGVDGKRLVGFRAANVEDADAARLKELVPAAK